MSQNSLDKISRNDSNRSSKILYIEENVTTENHPMYMTNEEDCETYFGHRASISVDDRTHLILRNIHSNELKHCQLLDSLKNIISEVKKDAFQIFLQLHHDQFEYTSSIHDFYVNPSSNTVKILAERVIERHFSLIKYALRVSKSPDAFHNIPISKVNEYNNQTSQFNISDFKNAIYQPTSWISQTVLNFDTIRDKISDEYSTKQVFINLSKDINNISQIDSEEELEQFRIQPKEIRSRSLSSRVEKSLLHKGLIENNNRRLLLCRFMVELTGSISGDRKLRQILLFNDILVCLKNRYLNDKSALSQTKNRMNIDTDIKWKIPLAEIKIYNKHIEYDEEFAKRREKKLTELKTAIGKLIKQKKVVDEMDKKYKKLSEDLEKLQTELIVFSPKYEFSIGTNTTCYSLLIDSEKEKNKWISTINEFMLNATINSKLPSNGDLVPLINQYKQLPSLNAYGLQIFTKNYDGALSGLLVTKIHKISGHIDPADYYLTIELDSFDQFETVAKTKIVNPIDNCINFNQTFELDMDQSQLISFNLYKRDTQISKLELVLHNDYLQKYEYKDHTTPIFGILNERVVFTISLNLMSIGDIFKRKPSIVKQSIFSKSFQRLIEEDIKSSRKKRSALAANDALRITEGKDSVFKEEDYPDPRIPVVITTLLDEIERRGLYEEGIYRIAGTMDIVNGIRKDIDLNFKIGIKLILDCDIHVVAGLIKLLFRETPEPLILYPIYQELLTVQRGINEKIRASEYGRILNKLPIINKRILGHLIKHFLRVDANSEDNKMNLSNLARVWALNLMKRSVEQHQQPSQPLNESNKMSIIPTDPNGLPNMNMLKEVEDVAKMNHVFTEILQYSKQGLLTFDEDETCKD